MKMNTIYHGSCEQMNHLGNESIDFIIAGPPYANRFDYAHSANNGERVPFSDSKSSIQEIKSQFVGDITKWFAECYRVLKNGRYCAINVGTINYKGQTLPLPFWVVNVLENIGFTFVVDIIWKKTNGSRRSSRSFFNNPIPGRFSPNIQTEYVLIVQKNPSHSFYPLGQQRTSIDPIPLSEIVRREWANNVWHLPVGHSDPLHPCPFPIELPWRLIHLYSLSDDIVLDPFMGVGTTARAAKELGRSFVGYELQTEFIQRAYKLLDEPFPKIRESISVLKRFQSPQKPNL